MKIAGVLVRFYKAFNFDYLRKAHPDAASLPWERSAKDAWYPFVSVSLDPAITTVVGANESGKSQLIGAVASALTGDGIHPKDFCRYSELFVVDREMRLPDFGLKLTQLDDQDLAALESAIEVPPPKDLRSLYFMRPGGKQPEVFWKSAGDSTWTQHHVKQPSFEQRLPRVFEIDPNIPIPDSVSLRYLADPAAHVRNRAWRLRLLEVLQSRVAWTPEAMTQEAGSLLGEAPDETDARQLQLADALLSVVSGINRDAFKELLGAVQSGNEGFAEGIVQRINTNLNNKLNLQRHWTQDKHFALLVKLRDEELVFTIRDRTGTEYSFSERSYGLKFFLSYLVQFLSHTRDPERAEILLMDEPDAYLSSQGQQDLLKLFQSFAVPAPDGRADQVLYVTHSPFLIDKNHSERIRVLDKGDGDEGTRVVRSAAQNHYEPLRSAFGAFVGETTFISNCNLMLEGSADQVLLVGMTSRLRSLDQPEIQNLDLNSITLVPAGSAEHVPYLAYLARGRDEEKPAVIVLLDSDEAGNRAAKKLKKGGPNNKRLLSDHHILQLGELAGSVTTANANGPVEIEDLVPSKVAVAAAIEYTREFLSETDAAKLNDLSEDDLDLAASGTTHGAVEAACVKVLGEDFHLDKVGFARSVLAVLGNGERGVIDENFGTLLTRLAAMQRRVIRELSDEKHRSRILRFRRAFTKDYPKGALRQDALRLFEDIEVSVVDAPDAEDVLIELRRLRKDFKLDDAPTEKIENYETFLERLDRLAYLERLRSEVVELNDETDTANAEQTEAPVGADVGSE